jgi:hypothetical protein
MACALSTNQRKDNQKVRAMCYLMMPRGQVAQLLTNTVYRTTGPGDTMPLFLGWKCALGTKWPNNLVHVPQAQTTWRNWADKHMKGTPLIWTTEPF